MRQVLAFAAAVLVGSTMIAATADAQGTSAAPGGYYVAQPAAQPAKPRLITRSTPWARQGATYIAARAPERDGVLCKLVVKQAGALTAFTVDGKSYDAEQLAKCNAYARGGAGATAEIAR
jgi:hypothetical protein